MIRSVTIRSFKAFADEDAKPILLRPVTLLVGPNGSGKSTILQAIAMMADLVRGNIDQMLERRGWEYRDLPHLLSAKQNVGVELDIDLPSRTRVKWSMTLGRRLHPGIAEEQVSVWRKSAWHDLVKRDGRTILVATPDGRDFLRYKLTLPTSWLSTVDLDEISTLAELARWALGLRSYFYLDPLKLRAASRSKTGEVGEHGEDLAASLAWLRRRPDASKKLIKVVREQFPQLEEIVTRRGKYGWTNLELTEKWNGEKATFNARQVSDGLLRLLAVAAMYVREDKPTVLLFDEIDNGLHPRLLEGFIGLLKELSKHTQVIATSHSPISLNYVDDDSALLVTRDDQGAVQVTPLREARGFAKLREHFALGELWYNVGEGRLVGDAEDPE